MILTLASQSPRRRDLLGPLATSLGFTLRLLPPDADENPEALEQPLVGEDPQAYVCRVTDLKAEAGWHRMQRKGLAPGPLLASDTTVVLENEILGKPADINDARRMLRALSDRSHQVLTAVTLLCPVTGSQESWSFITHRALSLSEVLFGPLSDDWIEKVIASGEPMDKAGAYAIQGQAGARIREIRGSPSGIMGLPLFEVSELIDHNIS
jgi:septum formation protein